MLRSNLVDGMLAGVMIAIGGSVFMACDNRYYGAVFFTVALLSICMFGFSLYTGKVGFIVKSHSRKDRTALFGGLAGNLAATVIMGLMVAAALPVLRENAAASCGMKLEQTAVQTFLRGILCGILMYTAVWIYREKKSIAGILFCVPVFILAGFEHSVADMFYFALAGMLTWRSCLFILLVVLGNSLGGMLIPLLQLLKGEKEHE